VIVVVALAFAAGLGVAWASAAPIDRSTPQQTVAGFMRAAEEEDVRTAAKYLELDGRRSSRQTRESVEQLAEVLRWRVWVDPTSLSDTPEGDADDGEEVERVGAVQVDGERIPITLTRARRNDDDVWLFSATTLGRLPEMTAPEAAGSWLARIVPEAWRDTRIVGLWSWQWFGLLIAIAIGLPLGYTIGRFATFVLRKLAEGTRVTWDDEIVRATRPGLRFAFAWGVMGLIATELDLPSHLAFWVTVVARTPLILAGGWIVRKAVAAFTAVYLQSTQDDTEINARGLRTQIVILRRLSTIAIALVVLALVMMQFEVVRTVGWSLLASAGVAGVALGFAAQKSLADVIAGLQLSMTQPIRLGDVVVLQGQWGNVEEIALTYVRLKLFDERRMIVPTGVFLTQIFENWSAPGDGMIGIVELAVDPRAPVPRLRTELERLAREHPLHDGRECKLQVIDLNENRALLRARVSTSDVGRTFELRCDIREAMVDYLQRLDDGRYLARRRWEQVD
jgi:small-conductance mechanosensitive channel